MEWTFRAGFSRSKHVDANAAYEVISKLEAQGPVEAEAVVEAARPKRSPIHGAFEWDDTAAAHQHRLKQARDLVTHLVPVVEKDAPRPPVQFVHVRTGEAKGYVATSRAMSDPEFREQTLMSALAGLRSWWTRYSGLEQMVPLTRRVESLIKRIERDIEAL